MTHTSTMTFRRLSAALLLIGTAARVEAQRFGVTSLAEADLRRNDNTSELVFLRHVNSNAFGSVVNATYLAGDQKVLAKRPGSDQDWRELPMVYKHASSARAFADELRVLQTDCTLSVLPLGAVADRNRRIGMACDAAVFLSDKSLLVIHRSGSVASLRHVAPDGAMRWQSPAFAEAAERIIRSQIIVDDQQRRLTLVRVARDEDNEIRTHFERFDIANGSLLDSQTHDVIVSTDAVQLDNGELVAGEQGKDFDTTLRLLRLDLQSGQLRRFDLATELPQPPTIVNSICQLNTSTFVATSGRSVYFLDTAGSVHRAEGDFGELPPTPDALLCTDGYAYVVDASLRLEGGVTRISRIAGDGTILDVTRLRAPCDPQLMPATLFREPGSVIALAQEFSGSCEQETRRFNVTALAISGTTVVSASSVNGVYAQTSEVSGFRLADRNVGMHISQSAGSSVAFYRTDSHELHYRALDRPLGYGGQLQEHTVTVLDNADYVACGVDHDNHFANALLVEFGNLESGVRLQKRIALDQITLGGYPARCFAHPQGVEWVGAWQLSTRALLHFSVDLEGNVLQRPPIPFSNQFVTLIPTTTEGGSTTDSGFAVVETSGYPQRLARVNADGSIGWQTEVLDARWLRLLPSGVTAYAGDLHWGFIAQDGVVTSSAAISSYVARIPGQGYGLVVRADANERRYDMTGVLVSTTPVIEPYLHELIWRSPRFALRSAPVSRMNNDHRLLLTEDEDVADPAARLAFNERHDALEPRYAPIELDDRIVLVGTARLNGDRERRKLFIAEIAELDTGNSASMAQRIAARTQITCMAHEGVCANSRNSLTPTFVW